MKGESGQGGFSVDRATTHQKGELQVYHFGRTVPSHHSHYDLGTSHRLWFGTHTMAWKLLLRSRNETSGELKIGHRPSTSNSLNNLLPSSSRRLFSFNQLNKLQTDHLRDRLSKTSRIMPNVEGENSQSGLSGVLGPVATPANLLPSLSRLPSPLHVNKVNCLETRVAQILSLFQNRPASTALSSTTAV